MINVEYTLEFSQCSQGLLEVVDVSGLLLSVSYTPYETGGVGEKASCFVRDVVQSPEAI